MFLVLYRVAVIPPTRPINHMTGLLGAVRLVRGQIPATGDSSTPKVISETGCAFLGSINIRILL